MSFKYTGQNRSGAHVSGGWTKPRDVAEFVEGKYRAGWRWLLVHDEAGDVVGSIVLNMDTARRVWWADTAAISS